MATLVEILSGETMSGLANVAELVGFAVLVRANFKLNKLFKNHKEIKMNKNTVYNTLAFDPKYTGKEEIKPADFRGQVLIEGDKVTKGAEIVNQIPANPEKVFLVNKVVFDYAVSKGWHNVAMFDPSKTEYGTLPNGKQGALSQGGLIFGDEV